MKLKVKSSLHNIMYLLVICLFLIPTISKIYIISTTQKNINRNLEPKLNAPTIIIIAPTNNQLFGISAPNYIVDISDPSGVNTTWYTIDGGFTNYTFTINGTINQGAWNIRPNGNVTIRFYAVDMLENLNFEEITVRKSILAQTNITILSNSGVAYITGHSFDIVVEYVDTILSTGIDGATVEYSLDGGSTFKSTNVTPLGSGQYNITINVNDSDFISYGFVDIEINASKQFYENRSTTYMFHRQITTLITPLNIIDLGSVMKGSNISYTFHYSDTTAKPIQEVSWSRLSSPVGFTAFLENLGNGNYTMHLDTTNVLVTGSAYDYEFNISATGNETQIIRLTVNVLIIQTDIIHVESISEIARSSGLNQSVRFYFNDTTNNLPVLNVITADIVVKNYATGTPFNDGEFWLLDLFSNGTYILDITMGTRNSGWYTLEINASKFPNYGSSVTYITFYLRGNYTDINLISLSDPGGALSPIGLRNFTIFEGSYLDIEFNMTDSDNYDNLILGDADSYTARYTNLDTGSNGILVANLNFTTQLHTGKIFTSNPDLTIGRYSLNITTSRTNYEDATFIFNLTIIERYHVRVNFTYTRGVDAGVLFTIVVKAEFLIGTVWFPLKDCIVMLRPYFNDNPSPIQTSVTNSTGEVLFVITVLGNTITMNLTIQLLENYYHGGDIFPISDIEVIPLPPGLAFEDLLPYFIIIGAVIAVAAGSIIVYRKILSPKKRKVPIVLEDVKTIFDDAINLKHIFVFFKRTGTCIFFKSFESEEIHPILISGYISIICSYSKDLEYQERVNKINYDDKTLLISDGEYIRIALLLTEKVSKIFHRNLIELVNTFEINYANELQNWRWQFNAFINAGTLIDEKLSISINLPHEIAVDISSIKPLRSPYSKDVLKIANELVEESERNFLTFTTLLNKATEKTHRDTKEIFMGIKELRDKKILIPIEIDNIEAQPITQEELTVINQKVSALANLTPEEKEKVINNLAQIGSAERRVYMASLKERNEIVSAPIDENLGDTLIDNVKKAKKEINELVKIAQLARNEQDYMKAINLYRKALKVATEYELARELEQLTEFIHSTESEKYFDLEENN